MLSVPMFEIMNKTSFSTVLSFLAAWVCFTDMASAAILIRPLNLVVRSGESIELSCRWDAASSSQDDTIEWYHTPIGSTSESKINYGHEIVNVNFKGATLNGNITGQKLKITLAQKQHAGLYTCTSMIVDKNGSMSVETAASHVVFLAADTVCQMRSNVIQAEYGVFEVCCMLSYAGSLIPAMNWRLANGNRLIERALNVTPVISENSAISTLTLVADSSLNGSRFICETVFDILSTKSNPTVANNTPGYNYTWTSSFVQVHYGPRNLRVNPAGDVFYPDDNLTCMADGNPNPEVLWLNLGTKAVARGPTVTITEEMIRDQPYLFLCRVTNPATNQNQEVTTKFTVKQRCIRSDSTVLKILLAVTLAVSAAIIATLSCYIAIGKRRNVMAYSESGPRNLVISAGKETKIPCNAGPEILGIDWYFVDVGGSDEIKLSARSQVFSAGKDFSVSGKIPGESLSINSTKSKHAGKYICTTLERQKNRSSADVARFITQVIVLESDPECHLNAFTVKERDNIAMWCIVRYSGNWAPVIEWREINGNIINEVLTESTNNSLTSTLSVAADASKHNSSYAFLICFTTHQDRTIAGNVPDYKYTWTSPNVLVLYGPKEASLSPHKDFYFEGDEVVCLAEGYLSPRFEWKILENNETFDGPVLVIRSEMICADVTSIQCTAINDATALQAKSRIVAVKKPGIHFRKRTTTEVKESKTFSELGLPVAVLYDQTYDSLNYELMGESDVETTTNVNSGTRSTLAEINQELQTEQPVKDDPSYDYATVTQSQSVDNVLFMSREVKSDSISTTSSSSEPNEVLSEYTALGEREPIKSSAYIALVRPETSEIECSYSNKRILLRRCETTNTATQSTRSWLVSS